MNVSSSGPYKKQISFSVSSNMNWIVYEVRTIYQFIFDSTLLCSAEARVTNSNNYPILRREPLPDATPNMAAIRGYVDSKIHLF